MMKGQKGITLVALIITIIVMLILVGVSISVALNGGIFTQGGDASRKTKQAQISEAAALAKAELLSKYHAAETDAGRIKPDAKDDVQPLVNSYLDGITVTVEEDKTTPGKYNVTTTDVDYDSTKNEKAPVIDLSDLKFAEENQGE